MTNKKISDLTATTTVGDADLFALVQSGETKKITGEDLATALSPAAASTTTQGIVELATDAEAAAGVNTSTAVTPAALAYALLNGLGGSLKAVTGFSVSGTWNKTTGSNRALVFLWGAGGGGNAVTSPSTFGAGSAGGNSTFGSYGTANGAGGALNTARGGAGGTTTAGSGTLTSLGYTGNAGQGGFQVTATGLTSSTQTGGAGGGTFLGGSGRGAAAGAGGNAAYGSGGGGAALVSSTNLVCGGGGGAGGLRIMLIDVSAVSSVSVTIGAGGGGGTGINAGGNGGDGYCLVMEYA